MKNKLNYLLILIIILVILVIYNIFSFTNILVNTGKVIISTTQNNISEYIYNNSSSYYNLGTGNKTIRLKPGNYNLVFIRNKNIQNKVINIKNGQVLFEKIYFNKIFNSIDYENNFVKLLPNYGPAFEYSITYKYSFVNNIATPNIVLTYTTQKALFDALSWINTTGFNINLLNISKVQGNVSLN